jgi:hypothetical protein
MGDLRELLRRAAVTPTAAPPLRQIERRAKHRMWRSRLSIAAVAIVIPMGLLLVPGLTDLVGHEDPVGLDRRPERPEESDVLASGQFDPAIGDPLGGKPWELLVWDQSEERFCWEVSVDGDEQGTNCGPRDRAAHGDEVFRGWGYNKLGGAGGATQSLAMGEIREDVEFVEFRFRDGEILPAQVIEPTSDMEIPARFFVAALPDLRPGHVAALDSAGDVLATRDMRVQERCADHQSYGRTIPGRWLKEVILNLGAPGGYEVTNKQVRDTGTALSIDIPQYDNDPTIYATMLTPGDDPNITSSPPKEEVGRHGSYTLYLQKGNPWQSYTAIGADWQLSLIAYPGADNDQIAWPDGILEWLAQAAKIAQDSPPECSGPLN